MSEATAKSKAAPYALGLALGLGASQAPPVFIAGAPAEGASLECHVERTGLLQGDRVCAQAFGNLPPPASSLLEVVCDADGGCVERPASSQDELSRQAEPDAGQKER